ncbi:GntR family transcriptional regulator [Paraburkholderia unamae]|uniref:DNA-binding GntR family transcriptional regulator n=1 Tax=Paraburkholderia unamae TaxID=219649 RepID=A0ABX5KV92_9BURK|nr:GntR family transcriptional regulator [Paraburkholderia unamae]PVX85891.1 DNA-binding GntR family transcriptional regulator [Paraburkholderia unamae]
MSETTHLHHQITEVLRDRIVDGVLPPGTPISERELCAEFNVSRTPLREALKVLASEGLVQLFRNRGAVVAAISVETIEEKLGIIGALEGYAARQVCLDATDEEIAELVQLHKTFAAEYDPETPERYFELHQALHRRIINLANNAALRDTYNLLSRHVQRARVEGLRRHGKLPDVVSENAAIVRAIRLRDTAAAQRAVEKHLSRVAQAVLTHFRTR